MLYHTKPNTIFKIFPWEMDQTDEYFIESSDNTWWRIILKVENWVERNVNQIRNEGWDRNGRVTQKVWRSQFDKAVH